jgi:hypothetical protein
MSLATALSVSEFASLKTIADSFDHSTVSEADARRLIDLTLIYKLLGSLRITHAGRLRIASGS